MKRGLPGMFGVVLGSILAMSSDFSSHAFAQGDSWNVLVGYAPLALPETSNRIALRPNTPLPQPVYLWLQNSGKVLKKNVKVTLVRLSHDGTAQELSQGELKRVDVNGKELVKFALPAPPAKAEAPPKEPLLGAAAGDPPFRYELWIDDENMKRETWRLNVNILQPHEYVAVKSPKFEEESSRLSVLVEAKPGYDPASSVRLVLSPEFIPGLIRPKLGLFKDSLTADKRKVTLFGQTLRFKGSIPKHGRAHITVDGYERAFALDGAFDEDGDLQAPKLTRLRLKMPRYFSNFTDEKVNAKGQAKPLPKLVIDIEADGNTDDGTWIEVLFDRAGDGTSPSRYRLPGLRQQQLFYSVGKDGLPYFQSVVHDWKLELDANEVFGKKMVSARVLDTRNKVDVARELADDDGVALLFEEDFDKNPHAQVEYDAGRKAIEAFVTIIGDDRKPEGVAFVSLPGDIAPGSKVRLKASADKRDGVEFAPITKVQFFMGDPTKAPAHKAMRDKVTGLWYADFVVPADAKDKVEVAVQFITATGLTDIKAEAIPVKVAGVAEKEKKEKENSIITGVVRWDERPQPGRVVTLRDKNGKVVAETKTDKKGGFRFDNVAPGTYRVSSAIDGMLRGTVVATVTKEKGENIAANVSINRVP